MRRKLLAAAEHFLSRARFLPQLAHAQSLRNWLCHFSIAVRLFLPIFLFFSLLPAFSQRVISPVPGTFANQQTLILDLPKGAEAFYSYTNTDPLTSGFAYDGPVLIDMSGKISLRVAVINGEESEEYKIDYTVTDGGNPFAVGTAEKLFIDRIVSENILLCSGENVISVPRSLSLRIGDGEKPAMKGGILSVSADNRLSRYIPCIVSSGEQNWRFIIFLAPGEVLPLSKKEVPFEIENWSTFRFTGKNLIWAIDEGYWSASTDDVILDRSKSHIVYWQDVAYKSGNPIQSFVLPPKPSLLQESYNKSVVFNINGDLRYKLSLVSSGAAGEVLLNDGLYTTITFDTFEGDYISQTAVFALYCDGVYQGELSSSYEIDRQPPLPPKFIASEEGEYARRDVSLRVESEDGASVYLAVYGPLTVSANSYLDNNSEFDYIKPNSSDYVLYKSQPIELRAGTEMTVCYKAFAYSQDKSGNLSALSSYKVIIDEYNYFLDGNAPDFASDGSRLHPFNSFEQALSVINEGKFVHFFVNGDILLSEELSLISSNCSFTGMRDARFVLPPSGYILVRDASLEMQNCVVQKDLDKSHPSDSRLFVFERSAASFEDCEISGSFDSSGTVFSSEASSIVLKNSGLSVQASNYACNHSAVNSRIQIEKSRFASISDTAVNFSLKGGSLDLRNSECEVISHLGRIVEATGVNLRMTGNSFSGDFDSDGKKIKPVWKDEKSLILEDKNNKIEGF